MRGFEINYKGALREGNTGDFPDKRVDRESVGFFYFGRCARQRERNQGRLVEFGASPDFGCENRHAAIPITMFAEPTRSVEAVCPWLGSAGLGGRFAG